MVRVCLPQKRFLHSVSTFAPGNKQQNILDDTPYHGNFTIEKIVPTGVWGHFRPALSWRCSKKKSSTATIPFTSVSPKTPPHTHSRVTQLNQAQWLVLRSEPSWDHALSTVPGLLQLEQTTLVWLVAEPRCWDGSTCQRQALHASASLGASEPKKKWRPCAA